MLQQEDVTVFGGKVMTRRLPDLGKHAALFCWQCVLFSLPIKRKHTVSTCTYIISALQVAALEAARQAVVAELNKEPSTAAACHASSCF